MKQIIKGKVYSTDAAKEIACFRSPGSWGDFQHFEESLYQKRTGEYFIAGQGGPATKYSRPEGSNSWTGGEKIFPMTEDEARQWAEDHLSADKYIEIFPVQAEEPIKNTIGDNIRRLREAAGMTQTQLAEAAGTDQRQIWRYESGERTPDGYQIIAFAKALNVEPGELLL